MSCYEWMRGSIKIPTKEWASFRNQLVDAYNEREIEQYYYAMAHYFDLKERLKGKRNQSSFLQEAAEDYYDSPLKRFPQTYMDWLRKNDLSHSGFYTWHRMGLEYGDEVESRIVESISPE